MYREEYYINCTSFDEMHLSSRAFLVLLFLQIPSSVVVSQSSVTISNLISSQTKGGDQNMEQTEVLNLRN